jgi:hypothetical protein
MITKIRQERPILTPIRRANVRSFELPEHCTQCCLCLKSFNSVLSPVLVLCEHTFCRNCVLIRLGRAQDFSFKCPKCHVAVDGNAGICGNIDEFKAAVHGCLTSACTVFKLKTISKNPDYQRLLPLMKTFRFPPDVSFEGYPNPVF